MIRSDYTCDLAASQKEEAQLYREGWRDNLSKLVGLPAKRELDERFDAQPPEMIGRELGQEMGKTVPAKTK